MQEDMEEAEEQSLVRRLKPVKPNPQPIKKRAAPADKGKSNQVNDGELPEAGVIEGLGDCGQDKHDDGMKESTKTQKHDKLSLKEAIHDARHSLTGHIKSQEPHADNRKGKLFPAITNLKFSLAGHIKGWASNITPDEKSKVLSTSKSHTITSALSLAYEPPNSILSSAQATLVSGATTKSHQAPKASLAPPVPDTHVGSFGDDTLNDSQEQLDVIVSKTKGKKSILKITTTDMITEDVPHAAGSSKEKSIESNINALTEIEVDALSDVENNNAMDKDNTYLTDMDNSHEDEDVKMSEDDNSDILLHGPIFKKCKMSDTKRHTIVLLDSSDEDAVIDVSDIPPTGPVGVANKVRKAICLTSSTSIAVSEPAIMAMPWAKKVKTEEGNNLNQATQHLTEWHSNFDSTGLAIMIDFFAQNKDTPPKDLSEELLEDFVFIFEDMDCSDSMKAFQSPFMLQLFTTTHLHSTIGYAEVTAIKTDVLAAIGVSGVLAICAASLKHTIKCLSAGAINIDVDTLKMCPAQMKCKLHTLKTFNKYTGKDSTTKHAFSINNWGSATTAYLAAIKKKGDIYLKDTMSMAQKLLKKSGSAALDRYLHLNDDNKLEDIYSSRVDESEGLGLSSCAVPLTRVHALNFRMKSEGLPEAGYSG
ncbi:hypothetical protein F4604DRAFT_1924530 [Suillus subluteus]|nr:hypothetical protein F4604DRAFT_1924530 [Suillus subluteus]